VVSNRLSDLLSVLVSDPACLEFLCGKGIDPIGALQQILKGNFGHADISLNGDATRVAATSMQTGRIEDASIFVNNNGLFFDRSLSVGPRRIAGGTPRAQAFILLHELAHNTNVLRSDLDDRDAGKMNDQEIQDHCNKTIKSFRDR
jgi:hypothetical protein